jgi:2'-hydroxyisoflavone reductase
MRWLSEVACYCLVSTVSVYADFGRRGLREDAPLISQCAGQDGNSYGLGKAQCETHLTEALADRAFIVRPGILAGPGDYTDRFTYWAYRLSRRGKVITPDRLKERAIQILDVRDLASWIVLAISTNTTGTFNAVPPIGRNSFHDLVTACQGAEDAATAARTYPLTDEFLQTHGVEAFTDLPLWIPFSEKSFTGFMQIDGSKAEKAGLQCRPLNETVKETLAWLKQAKNHRPLVSALSAQKKPACSRSTDLKHKITTVRRVCNFVSQLLRSDIQRGNNVSFFPRLDKSLILNALQEAQMLLDYVARHISKF